MKVKGFDVREFGIQHGEKVVLGIVGLLVLFVLCRPAQPWKAYDGKPEAITQKVDQERKQLLASQWTNKDREKYPDTDFLKRNIDSMLQPINVPVEARGTGLGLAFSIDPSWRLYLKQKPLEKPKLYPIEDLTATAFRDVFQIASLVDLNPEKAKEKKEKEEKKAKEFVSGKKRTEKSGTEDPGAPRLGKEGLAGDGVDGEAGAGSMTEGEGRRAIAVRGIFRLRDQLKAYEKALNLPENLDPRSQVDIFNFVLQRRVSADGGKTWGNWTEVNLEKAIERLNEVAWEPDVVSSQVFHFRITSPLPMRLLRPWGNEATHKGIDNFKLSDKEREEQLKAQEKILKAAEKAKKAKSRAVGGGFGRLQRDINSQQQELAREGNTELRTGLQEVYNPTGEDPDRVKKAEETLKAGGHLLLFRFFDFDVLPGLTYQYKVHLELRNPLFGESTNNLAPEALNLREQELLKTPVSNETQPVTFGGDIRYFLADVERSPTMNMPEPKAKIDIFQWFTKPGTVIRGQLKDLEVGDLLAGTDKETTQVDPGKGVVRKNTPTEFISHAVLLDAEAGRRSLESRHMQELGLKNYGRVPDIDEILIVDESGNLKMFNPVSQSGTFAQVATSHKRMIEHFESEFPVKDEKEDDKKKKKKGMNEDGNEEGPRGVDEFIENGEGKTRRKGRRERRRSALRRSFED